MLVGSMNTTGAPCCASGAPSELHGATSEHEDDGGSKAASGAGELDRSALDAGDAGDGDGDAGELNAGAEAGHVEGFTVNGRFGVTSGRHDEREANTPW